MKVAKVGENMMAWVEVLSPNSGRALSVLCMGPIHCLTIVA